MTDALNAKQMPAKQWLKLGRNPFAPLAIPIDDMTQYRVTQVGVDAAHKITRQTWERRKELQQTIVRAEFDKLAFRAIGQAIRDVSASLSANVDPNARVGDEIFANIAADYEAKLDQLAGKSRPDLDRHITCHLFHAKEAVPAFSVGPVAFRPRAEWINHFVKDANVGRLIAQVEAKELVLDDLRKQAFAQGSSRDLHTAYDLLAWLGNHAWVATIRMVGHEPIQSHQKASIIVGLALDAVGLRFHVEDARRFAKAGRQHLYSEARMASTMDGRFLKGQRIQLPGVGGAPTELATKMQSEQPFLDAAGAVLQEYVDARQTGTASALIERWANALYWVGQARREESDFMAVVSYGCAADGLSGAGGDAKAMTTFAEAAINPKGAPTPAGSMSVDDAVNKVYREGRNKLAHGETPGLLEDLSETRAVGDALLCILFDEVTFELATVITSRREILACSKEHAYRAFEVRLRQRP